MWFQVDILIFASFSDLIVETVPRKLATCPLFVTTGWLDGILNLYHHLLVYGGLNNTLPFVYVLNNCRRLISPLTFFLSTYLSFIFFTLLHSLEYHSSTSLIIFFHYFSYVTRPLPYRSLHSLHYIYYPCHTSSPRFLSLFVVPQHSAAFGYFRQTPTVRYEPMRIERTSKFLNLKGLSARWRIQIQIIGIFVR